MHAYRCAELMREAQAQRPDMTPEETAEMLARMSAEAAPPSRAQLRMNAIRELTGGKRVIVGRRSSRTGQESTKYQGKDRDLAKAMEVQAATPEQQVFFSITRYAVLESDGKVSVVVNRTGSEGTVKVKFDTKSGTATKGKDFVQKTDKVHDCDMHAVLD